MARTPQSIIDEGRMGGWQMAAIAVTILLNALDGFDVMSISFAAPGIAKEWGVAKDVLGWVLSMELIGMAAGSILLGGLADRIGRKPTIMGCLVVMAAGMLLAPQSENVTQLSIWRVLTGLGIGGMLAALNATVAEFSNARYRNLVLPLMVIGYPLGAFLGGLAAKALLTGGDWRNVFYLGAGLTAACIPLAFWLIPESPGWLNARRPAGALGRINAVLARFGLAKMEALPDPEPGAERAALIEIFRPAMIRTTILLTLAYLTHVTAYYYFVKWIPKLVVDMGFEPSAGAGVLTNAMLGGAIGGGLLGLVAMKIGMRWATVIALAGAFVMLNVFGMGNRDLALLGWIAGLTAFFSNAAAVGFYALLAMAFPPHVRATGTGFGIGFGRAGAAMGPGLAGMLFESGMGLQGVSLIISAGSLLAILCILAVRMPAAARGD
ncbi:MAG: MFS transporter [Sphingomonadales bacterium]|nr:MFS transporter [Sphingomonadales bacterium]